MTRYASLLALLLLMPACHRDAAPVAIHADAVLLGRVFDASRGQVVENGAVLVAGERIACAGTARSCPWTPDSPVHDYGDALLLPGLIDLHVHARPHYLGAFVPSGVTTVRDAGNTLDMVAQLRALPGAPRIIASGPLLDGIDGPWSAGPAPVGSAPLGSLSPVTASNAVEARAAVEALAAAGVDWIKLYTDLPPEAFTAATRAAREAGLPVMADLGSAVTVDAAAARTDILQAAAAGVTTVEHLGGIALAYRRLGGDPMAETLDEALLDRLADAIAASGMAVVPTLVTQAHFHEPGRFAVTGLPGHARLAPHFQDHWSMLSTGLDQPAVQARTGAQLRLLHALLPRLQAAGVAIGAGSDLPAAPQVLPGAAVHQELAALVAAGLTPAQALQSATRVAAGILGRDDLGRLEAGARADIVVVDGNPLQTIDDSRKVSAVWMDGAPVSLEAAWEAVEASLAAIATQQ